MEPDFENLRLFGKKVSDCTREELELGLRSLARELYFLREARDADPDYYKRQANIALFGHP